MKQITQNIIEQTIETVSLLVCTFMVLFGPFLVSLKCLGAGTRNNHKNLSSFGWPLVAVRHRLDECWFLLCAFELRNTIFTCFSFELLGKCLG